MQLIKKLFGKPEGNGAGPESAQFHESDSGDGPESRNAPRRELVQVVLRDTMRRHGIPSAWIDCRILSVVNRNSRPGLHVQLIVRDGIDRLLTYVPAFQTGFMDEISRFDPRVEDWLFSLSWQFLHLGQSGSGMPDPAVWAGTTAAAALTSSTRSSIAAPAPVASPASTTAPVAVSSEAAPPVSRREPGLPARAPVHSAPPHPAPANPAADDEMMQDLQALYAIRDAALGQGRPQGGAASEQDFESTHPGADDEPDGPVPPAAPAGGRRW